MMKRMTNHDVIPNSISCSNEEEEEVVVEEVEQSAKQSVEVESSVLSAILTANAMMS